MVKSVTVYEGGLHCAIEHGPSGSRIATDAPVDNMGKGEAFSPTDLVGAALASCIATTMAIVADRKGIDLRGMRVEAVKEMSADTPRRIARLAVEVHLPISRSADPEGLLERAGRGCPVHRSLHPDVDAPIVFHWKD